jgi:glucokinase
VRSLIQSKAIYQFIKSDGLTMVILAGEIGKQTTELALFTHKRDETENRIVLDSLLVGHTFTTKDYADQGMRKMVEEFLQNHHDGREEIYGACFGIASPINHGKAKINAQDFSLSFTEHDLRQVFPYKNIPLAFINDMEAIGYGIFLGDGEDKLEELYTAEYQSKPEDNRALMLVTDGLGQALWHSCSEGQKLKPIPSEGGHTDFGVSNDQDIELLKFLKRLKQDKDDNSPVSYEYVLSRPGLVRIYQFVKNLPEWGNQPDVNDADTIIQLAQSGNTLCKNALDQFISIWGAQAGNLALTYKAVGGVYIGGISIPIEILKEGKFRDAFINKEGDFGEDNKKVSIKVFQEKDIVLWGAARHAIESGFVTKGKFAIMRANQ